MLRRHKAAIVIQSQQRGRNARGQYRSDLAAVVRLQMGLRRWQVTILSSACMSTDWQPGSHSLGRAESSCISSALPHV